MIRYLLLILSLYSVQFAQAQLLDGFFYDFTKADTLRGALRPERTCFDVTYYHLNLHIDTSTKSIYGYNDIHYKATENFHTLQIDLFDNMTIDSIVFEEQTISYRREYNAVFVEFEADQPQGSYNYFRIYYHGQPIIAKNPPWDGGFTWNKTAQGQPWIGVSCEGIGASLWWPNKDHLSDEPDSMRITGYVPQGLELVCNGELEEKTEGDQDGWNAFTWKINYPINNYNVTLNIAPYAFFEDAYKAEDGSILSLQYYVLPENLEKAKTHFEQVKPMMACYEHYFGKFPFWKDGFALVETPYLGMEHQTAIAYGNEYLTGYAGYDYSRIGLDFDYIIIHEAGHEYWGNLISCADMADLWIHEGFCTYSEALYVECMFDYQTALDYINAKKPTIGNEFPMIGLYDVNMEGDGDMYNKGMLFLNTIRHIVNDDVLWFAMLKEMTTKEFAYKTISTSDVLEFFNRKTKMNFDAIFEQYLNHPNIPALYFTIEKIEKNHYELRYKWQVDVDHFNMPFVVSIGDGQIRLDGTTEMQSYSFQKKRKDPFTIHGDIMYFDIREF